jgi:hypothetical protein
MLETDAAWEVFERLEDCYFSVKEATERAAFAVNPGDMLTADEAETLRLMLKTAADRLPKEKQGALMMQGWSKLKAHFKVSYRSIPRHEFSEAVSIIARHTAEWEVVDDTALPTAQPVSDAERIKLANRLATHAASVVHQTVFEAVIDGGKWWQHDRYLLSFNAGTDGKFSAPWAKPIGEKDMVVSMADLPARLLEAGGMAPSNKDLANLAAACNQRLAGRL